MHLTRASSRFLTLAALALGALTLVAPKTAWGLGPEAPVKRLLPPTQESYGAMVDSLALTYARGRRPVLGPPYFARLDWQERIALLNLVCAEEEGKRCLEALDLGLTDGALVVRDHAFRLLLALPRASTARRQAAAKGILSDDRNYRKGRGLWIVERAEGFLAGAVGPARP